MSACFSIKRRLLLQGGLIILAAWLTILISTFERELKRLEKRVDALVSVCDQLQDENRSLKQRQDVLTTERAGLLQKNEQVRARVEAMIGRLKAMEQGS